MARVLITFGATAEYVDPVRCFISSQSSGRTGTCIAHAFLSKGHDVFGIAGHVSVDIDFDNVRAYSSKEMSQAVEKYIPMFDIFISVAAISDFIPKEDASAMKVKSQEITINFKKNRDILQTVFDKYKNTKYIVGFALETHNHHANAIKKLGKCHMVAVNDASAALSSDTSITLLTNNKTSVFSGPKEVVGERMSNEILISAGFAAP